MTLGDLIRKYRKDNGYSMERFAKRCGLSKSYISMLEANKDPRGKPIIPRIETVIKVADAMNTTLDELIADLDYNFAVRINNEIVSEDWEDDSATFEEVEPKNSKEIGFVIELDDPGDREEAFAKRLYELYRKADPKIKAAVDALLKEDKPS